MAWKTTETLPEINHEVYILVKSGWCFLAKRISEDGFIGTCGEFKDKYYPLDRITYWNPMQGFWEVF